MVVLSHFSKLTRVKLSSHFIRAVSRHRCIAWLVFVENLFTTSKGLFFLYLCVRELERLTHSSKVESPVLRSELW